jgi:hypothetical protein
MIKNFCDICKKPAVKDIENGRVARLKPHPAPARLYIKLTINFIQHPTGYGSTPDLCLNCYNLLVEELKK